MGPLDLGRLFHGEQFVRQAVFFHGLHFTKFDLLTKVINFVQTQKIVDMNFQDLLLEETVKAQVGVPKTFSKEIKSYQKAYRAKTGRTPPSKDELIIKMMHEGVDQFRESIKKLTRESES